MKNHCEETTIFLGLKDDFKKDIVIKSPFMYVNGNEHQLCDVLVITEEYNVLIEIKRVFTDSHEAYLDTQKYAVNKQMPDRLSELSEDRIVGNPVSYVLIYDIDKSFELRLISKDVVTGFTSEGPSSPTSNRILSEVLLILKSNKEIYIDIRYATQGEIEEFIAENAHN